MPNSQFITPVFLECGSRAHPVKGEVHYDDIHGGAGLSLSIARWAVEVHGGEIGVRSEEARGSTFWIHLPKVGASDGIEG